MIRIYVPSLQFSSIRYVQLPRTADDDGRRPAVESHLRKPVGVHGVYELLAHGLFYADVQVEEHRATAGRFEHAEYCAGKWRPAQVRQAGLPIEDYQRSSVNGWFKKKPCNAKTIILNVLFQ